MPSLLPRTARFAAFVLAVAVSLLHPGFAGAQALSSATDRVLLPGNIHPLAQGRFAAGPVAPAAPTGRLRVLLKRSPARQAALDSLLDAMRDPRSPQYHQWLTPEEYGARFGASNAQIDTVSAWLRSQGFAVSRVPAGRMYVEASGRMGYVESAFHAGLHSFTVDGVTRLANSAEPSIPAALAPMIAGIAPLNDFPARAQAHTVGSPMRVGAKPSPLLSNPQDGTVFVTPAEAATVYDAPNALNRNFSGGTERRGSGVSIGIAGYSDLAAEDYLNYRRQLLHEADPPAANLVVDGIDPTVLDQHDGQVTLIASEIASGLAPGANLYVYSSQSDLLESGLTNAVIRAIEDNKVDILELSYSVCELALGAGGNAEYNELWEQAAAQGITVVVAAGDGGSAGCDAGAAAAAGGLAVNGLASSPYALAVGGTDFDVISAQFRPYIADPNAPPYQATFAGYIPEAVWNDAVGNNPPGGFASNVTAPYGPLVAAGGGGASALAFCVGGYAPDGSCPTLTGYPQPAFQANAAPGRATRTLPDVAVFAGTHRQYAATWAVCSDTAVAQAAQPVSECVPAADGSFSVEGAGGTGTAAPAFAGMLAVLLEAERAARPGLERLGIAANGLYNLAQTSPSAFHDITVGNNSVPCTPGSPDCAGNGFLAGQDAGPGYDLASGLGSVDLSALVAAWPSITYTPTTLALTVNNTAGPITLNHGDPVEFEAAVDPSTAAGAVSLQGGSGPGGLAVNERIQLNAGTGSLSTHKLPGGTYSIQGYYAGDATHAAGTSENVQVTIRPEDSILNTYTRLQDPVTGAVSSIAGAIPYGTYGFFYVEPVSRGGDSNGPATGTVNLLNSSVKLDAPGSPSAQPLNSVGRAAYPLDLYPPGVYQLTATYGGDASYGPSATPTPLTLIIGQAPTNLSAQSSAASVDVSGAVTITVVLSTQSTGQYPSGPVVLTANGKNFPGTIQQSLAPGNLDVETAVFQVSASALVPGSNLFNAAYAGDTNYTGSSATLTVNVTGAPVQPASFSITGPFNGITLPSSATSVTGAVTLQAVNGFTGAVSLSCAWKDGQSVGSAKCAVQTPVNLSANAATAVVTITATPPPFDPNAPRTTTRMQKRAASGFEGGIALCSLLLLTKPVRKRFGRTPLLVVAAAGLLSAIGCGVQITEGTTRQDGIFSAVITGTSGSTTAKTEVLVHIE